MQADLCVVSFHVVKAAYCKLMGVFFFWLQDEASVTVATTYTCKEAPP